MGRVRLHLVSRVEVHSVDKIYLLGRVHLVDRVRYSRGGVGVYLVDIVAVYLVDGVGVYSVGDVYLVSRVYSVGRVGIYLVGRVRVY